MPASGLIYIGIHGRVIALDRRSGGIVWATPLKQGLFGTSGFVNVVYDEPHVLATHYGEAFCLDAATGQLLWHNELKGMGTDLATIAIPGQAFTAQQILLAQEEFEQRRRNANSSSGNSASSTP